MFIPCDAKCDRVAANFFTSVRDWGRYIWRNLPIVLSGSGIWTAQCQCTVFYEIRGRYDFSLCKGLANNARWWKNIRTNSVWGFSCKKSGDTRRSCWRTTSQPHKLIINKEQSQLSFAPSLLLMLQVNQGPQQIGSQVGHWEGVTIDWAIAIFGAHRPLHCEPWPPYPCHP